MNRLFHCHFTDAEARVIYKNYYDLSKRIVIGHG